MQKPKIAVVDADEAHGAEFCTLLTKMAYAARLLTSMGELATHLESYPDTTVIMNLDSIAADQRIFRELRKKHPRLHILGVSSKAHHPGLEEVIGSHLYACLVKPLDTEELTYWLKTIAENLAEPEVIAEP